MMTLILTALFIENAITACTSVSGTILGTVVQLNNYTALILTIDNCYVRMLIPAEMYDNNCNVTSVVLHKGDEVEVVGTLYPSDEPTVIPEIIKVGSKVYYSSPTHCVKTCTTVPT